MNLSVGLLSSLCLGDAAVELAGEHAFGAWDELAIGVCVTCSQWTGLIDDTVAVVVLSIALDLLTRAVKGCWITGGPSIEVLCVWKDLLCALAPKTICAASLGTIPADPSVALVEFTSEARLCCPW